MYSFDSHLIYLTCDLFEVVIRIGHGSELQPSARARQIQKKYNQKKHELDTVGFEPTTSRSRCMRSVRATPVPSARYNRLAH